MINQYLIKYLNATKTNPFSTIEIFDDIIAYSSIYTNMIMRSKSNEGRVLNYFPGTDLFRVTFNLYDNNVNY